MLVVQLGNKGCRVQQITLESLIFVFLNTLEMGVEELRRKQERNQIMVLEMNINNLVQMPQPSHAP